jgi:hypothetical protein
MLNFILPIHRFPAHYTPGRIPGDFLSNRLRRDERKDAHQKTAADLDGELKLNPAWIVCSFVQAGLTPNNHWVPSQNGRGSADRREFDLLCVVFSYLFKFFFYFIIDNFTGI